ncbi:MAG: hypothetical protein CMJ81_20135 [Planctomycetaceae bacterium]|nr:hypothetical protein [Planctomycetaceae bacterium]MBP62599.1 hypothetical protein [Planctomycetaceae bacterium]
MTASVQVHEGKLAWSGDHWILGIRPQGAEQPSAWVSLFHTRYSPAGEGIAAQILLPGDRPISVICTDQPEVGRFTREQFFSAGSYFDPEAPLVDAQFQRRGDIRKDPAWIIETDAFRIVARWQITQPAVVAAGTFCPGTEHFTLLFFSDAASVQRDEQSIEGQPYPRDIWKPSIGGERSSCVIALAESLIELHSDDVK